MLNQDYAEKLFNLLYENVDGYAVSHQARQDIENKSDLLYGELPFKTWIEIVEKAAPKKDGIFLDIGSGTGRVVMLSYLFFDFKKTIGVELLKGLHDKACEVQEIFEKNIKSQIANQVLNRELKFFNQNIFEVNLSEIDFIFMNHPFKDRDLFDKLEQKFLRDLKPQTKIVTTIRALKDKAFKNLGSQKYQFSWGESTAYFHEV
ncbi:MAG: hypothetical protein SFV53_06720 [Rickettsiales bacterium]|nr:hypothetical protein [Rickettsiales bacterium]